MDLSVEGKVYLNGVFEKCCIGVTNGKISEIKKILKADEHYNFGNKLIFPSGVDSHVHFRDPGMLHKEDFSTGSMAAAFGGITCVFDMPNTIPQTSTIQSLDDKIISAERKSYIDFGVHAGINNENISEIPLMSTRCNGFKIYLGSTTLSLLFEKSRINQAFKEVSKTGKPIFFHAEDEECLIKHKSIENNLTDHMKFRPSVCEEKSIKFILEHSKRIDCRIHICHLSSCEGLELLKNKPGNISFGITPHHALLSIDKTLSTPTFYKVNPPIRTSFDKEALFNSLKNNTADILESDHAPHSKEEKDTDFDTAPCGVPGVETMYPLFLYLVKKEIFTFQQLIPLISEKPAQMMGASKGTLEVGKDADFIVVDMKNESRIKSDNLHSKCSWTPFEDWPAIFPEFVFIRGEKLIEDNELQVSEGFGQFVGE